MTASSVRADENDSRSLQFGRNARALRQALDADAGTARAIEALVEKEAGLRRARLGLLYLFNIYDRLADTMGWHVPEKSSGAYEAGARTLLQRGYL